MPPSTISKWKSEHKEFSEALRNGKPIADACVATALYRRAVGYSHPEDKVFQYKGKPIVVPTTKHYPPDIQAASLWLRNRQPERWRDKQELEHQTGPMTINVITGTGADAPGSRVDDWPGPLTPKRVSVEP